MATPSHTITINAISIWWITWTCVWTALLSLGLFYLYHRRHLPSIQIRGLSLTIASICMLHVYWILCSIGYVIGPSLPEMTEFWVMSLYFPAGLALFQAANMRLLYVSREQERYTLSSVGDELFRKGGEVEKEGRSWGRKALLKRLRRMDSQKRLYLYIAVGMVCQICVTNFVFCISRKFHPTWGIRGTEATNDPLKRGEAINRGWEWIPSIVWQIFWTWICAPYILWKTRHIKDTHGWRLQTAICCIAGLPAAPLWLTALYAPSMAKVNQYWIPPQWICVSVFIIEIATVFLPCYIAFRHQSLHSDTLTTIQEWESKNVHGSFSSITATDDATLIGHNGIAKQQQRLSFTEMHQLSNSNPCADANTTIRPMAVYSMESLEQCLRLNPEPLQRFAALKDFSGENVAFLRAVAGFKQHAESLSRDQTQPHQHQYSTRTMLQTTLDDVNSIAAPLQAAAKARHQNPEAALSGAERRHLFNAGLRIYVGAVSLLLAPFPINLSSREYKCLETVFQPAAEALYGRRGSSDSQSSGVSTLFDQPTLASRTDSAAAKEDKHGTTHYYRGSLPEGFHAGIFDQAEKSIKHLVLLNTWAKFVREGVGEEVRREGMMERLVGRNDFEGGNGVSRRWWPGVDAGKGWVGWRKV